MDTSDRLTVVAIARQEIASARRRPRRHRLSHMIQRVLVWYGPQLLFIATVGLLLFAGWLAMDDLGKAVIR